MARVKTTSPRAKISNIESVNALLDVYSVTPTPEVNEEEGTISIRGSSEFRVRNLDEDGTIVEVGLERDFLQDLSQYLEEDEFVVRSVNNSGERVEATRRTVSRDGDVSEVSV